MLWFLIPHGIGTSWRECDTQAIARNFLLDGFDPMRPRIDWRGQTDGAVECEFPLYEAAIAVVQMVAGDVEWPGRLFSLLSMLAGAWALHRLLERRAGPSGAIAGLCVFLASGSAILLGARVMPDAASFGAGMLGLLVFDRWLRGGSGAALVMATALVTLSGLQKPLSLQLGLVMFGWTLVSAPQRLRDARLWLAFVVILGVVAAWLVHGAHLHAETGLSFGVVSGGDSKFPDFGHLVDSAAITKMAVTSLTYGFSVFGVLGFVVAWRTGRLHWRDAPLLVAAAAGIMVSFRYSHDYGLGPHYHVFAAAAGAWCTAVAWPRRPAPWLFALLIVATAAHGVWRLRDERGVRNVVNQSTIMAAAQVVKSTTQPGDLLIVRSDKPRRDVSWGRGNNFEDPRLLYQSQRRGFVLPVDEFDVPALAELHRRGGVVVFDPLPETTSASAAEWLARHGELIFDRGMRVWRLNRLN